MIILLLSCDVVVSQLIAMLTHDMTESNMAFHAMPPCPVPPFTAQHVEEWASFGPPIYQKPNNEQEWEALRLRKQNIQAMKQRLAKEFNTSPSENAQWSTKAIERELNRLVAAGAHGQQQQQQQHNQEPKEPRRQPPPYQLDNSHPSNILDHRKEGGPLLQYLWSTEEPLHGQTLYLGGEVGSDNNIYCIPGHASQVLQINTANNTIRPIGPHLTSNGRLYKWLRGVVVGDYIYGLPCHADQVLRIHVPTLQVVKLDIPYDSFYRSTTNDHDFKTTAKEQRQMKWKYHGGNVCPHDGCIYAIPQAAHHVLRINPIGNDKNGIPIQKEEITLVGPEFPGKCKWYGGILGKQDGAIYGIPQNANGVLRIAPDQISIHGQDIVDSKTNCMINPLPNNDEYTGDESELEGPHNQDEIGNNATTKIVGQHRWHGGAAAANGDIVCVPANAYSVLCITPGNPPTLREVGRDAVIKGCGRHRSDGKYKYLGALAGTNGKVYLFPCASEYVLEVDTVRDIVKNVGPNLRDSGLELVNQNKWQNGLTCVQDQCVYGMPQSSHTLLRIDCSGTTSSDGENETTTPDAEQSESPDPIVTTWRLPSPRIECRDKFEGGVVMPQTGIMYTVPNNHKAVLRIEPAKLFSQN